MIISKSKKEKTSIEKLEEALQKLEQISKRNDKVVRDTIKSESDYLTDRMREIKRINDEYERRREEENKIQLERMVKTNNALEDALRASQISSKK